MKKYDVIVIGAGSGLDVAAFADEQNLKVAIVEKGPMGGTCLNRGCIPSKMLIHSADVAEIIKSSEKFGIKSKIESIDFTSIVKRVSASVDKDAAEIEKNIKKSKNATLYKMDAKFTGPKVLRVGDKQITSDLIIIASGTRPTIPSIKGLNTINYLTSKEALRLKKQPKHLVIIGAGYIAAELAHFYGSLETKITILVRHDKLVREEDGEISAWFTREFSKKYEILFNTEAEAFFQKGNDINIKLKGKNKPLTCDQVLIATGRIPNTDILDVGATGVEVNDKGFIKVDKYLKTNVEGIWAFGDIIGKLPLKHTANFEVNYIIRNAFYHKNDPVDFHGIAHAIFSSPQIAGVGMTEEKLKEENIKYKVGKYEYKDVAMGDAIQENGLVKVLAGEDGEILGCHIVGPDASILIHEAVVAMKTTGNIKAITNSVYVHPALPEVVQRAFESI